MPFSFCQSISCCCTALQVAIFFLLFFICLFPLFSKFSVDSVCYCIIFAVITRFGNSIKSIVFVIIRLLQFWKRLNQSCRSFSNFDTINLIEDQQERFKYIFYQINCFLLSKDQFDLEKDWINLFQRLTKSIRSRSIFLKDQIYWKIEDRKIEDRKIEDRKIDDQKIKDRKIEDRTIALPTLAITLKTQFK